MRWHHVPLSFARKDSIDLYVRDRTGIVEVLVGTATDKTCYSADRALGSIKDISLDQRGTQVPWQTTILPEFCRYPETDSRHNEMIPGHSPTLDYLRFPIANAMNRNMRDRGFSRYVKKQIIGSWVAADAAWVFSANGEYSVTGSPTAMPFPPPPAGKWFAGGRMLRLMNAVGDRGIRVAIVSVGERELRFHGRNGTLFHIYDRA
jgi:hypothetical protein